MIARRIRRSTATALAFIATSMPPTSPPRRTSATAAVQGPGISVSTRSSGASAKPVRMESRRDPSRVISAPMSGMVMSEPMPKARIISPSAASSMPRSALNEGIFGAQFPTTYPLARKSAETAARSRGMAPFSVRVSVTLGTPRR